MWEIKEVQDKDLYTEIWTENGLSFLQSWYWGEVKRPNWVPIRFLAEQKEGTKVLSRQVFTVLVRKVLSVIKLGYAPRLVMGSQEILALLVSHLKAKQLVDTLVLEFDDNANDIFPQAVQLPNYSTNIQPDYTNIIYLNKTEEEIWGALTGNCRRSIKKARKLGVKSEIIYPDDPTALDKFYSVMKAIFARTDYVMHGKGYFEKVWEYMGKQAHRAVIIIVKKEEKTIGAYLLTYDGKYANELYGGVIDEGKPLEAGYLLVWESILWAKSKGLLGYDIWGVASYDEEGNFLPQHPLYNISRFKARFGGRNIKFMPTKYFAINPLKTQVLLLGQKLQSQIIQLRKIIS